jgi:hypothetical protein
VIIKRLKSQIIKKYLGASKPEDLNMIVKTAKENYA